MHSSWQKIIHPEFKQKYFISLSNFLKQEYKQYQVFPPKNQVFSAFNYPLNEVKVVIIGQDPYHGVGRAHGLAFSVNESVKIPPSLQNIFKEISSDCHSVMPTHGNLDRWAKQGVLLLNNTLTVRANQAGSHRQQGWEIFTNQVIEYLNLNRTHLVYLLWGNDAKSKTKLINQAQNLILTAAHPSPLSAYHGFFGCHHFSQSNQYLQKYGYSPIIW